MGINFKTFKWLEKNINHENLSLGVIGRQDLNLDNFEKKKIGSKFFLNNDNYADSFLLKKLKLSKIISFDKSNYEKPTFIKNFEKEIYHDHKFDIFFDGGSLQHIYNIPKALENINKLTKIGGKILHTVVFNNFQGFGLYQLSPEIFFSIYSEKNGFENTKIYLVNNDDDKYWYRVSSLNSGEKYNFKSNGQLSIFVSTEKKIEVKEYFIHQKFYISDDITKREFKKSKLVNFLIYARNIIFSIFPNFFLNFDKKLKKERIE